MFMVMSGSVCVLSPHNEYYGSSLCGGCHYTSDLSVLLAEERKTHPPLSLSPHSHKLKTHNLTHPQRAAGTDNRLIFGCVCVWTETDQKHTRSPSCHGNQTAVPSGCIWDVSPAPLAAFWGLGGVGAPRGLLITLIIGHL